MSTSHHPYRYKPLTGDRIRILELHSGTANAVLMCRFREVSLSDPDILPFEALSYVWGTQPEIWPIRMWKDNGKLAESMEVKPSLAQALRRLRHDQGFRYLWVDALCINQGALDEKELQIAEMDQIY